jgi:hypothetical protein
MSGMSRRELEAQQYWRLMQSGMADMTVSEFKRELDDLAHHSGSKVVRDLCSRNESRYDRSFSVVRAARFK